MLIVHAEVTAARSSDALLRFGIFLASGLVRPYPACLRCHRPARTAVPWGNGQVNPRDRDIIFSPPNADVTGTLRG